MKKLLTILMMVLFSISLFAQPKVITDKHKKDGYTRYKVEMEMGGNTKTAKTVNTLKMDFSYKRHYNGYGDEGQMFFIHNGYYGCSEMINGKNTVILQLLVNGDTMTFNPTYWSVKYWATNGVIADRPDRYYSMSFYDLFDADIDKIISAVDVRIIKFGSFENADWYFSDRNLSDMKYLYDYSKSQEIINKK